MLIAVKNLRDPARELQDHLPPKDPRRTGRSMESLAAIGLAGNIVQFISFTFALISKSHELHQSVSGLSDETLDLHLVARDISKLSRKVSLTTSSPSQLALIAKRCENVAQELLNAISDIRNKQEKSGPEKRPTKWRSFRNALRYVWKKDQIEELKARLEILRDQLMLHMISNTSDGQMRLMDILAQWETKNMESGYELTTNIRELDTRLQKIQTCLVQLQDEAAWKTLHDQMTEVTAKVEQISRTHTIIESLRYQYMELRHETIKVAYKRTFEWVYRPRSLQASDPRSQIKFVHWLQRDNGIYWITGKPGSGKSTLMKYIYDDDDNIQNLLAWAGDMRLVRAQFYFWNPGQKMQKTLEGLLQTLLYHILQACPDLVSIICPERWSTDSRSENGSSVAAWTLIELQRSLARFKVQCSATTKFYFHIDGLDEYHGDCWEVIGLLKDLSTAPNVKLCLSSRPWNEFQDAFGRSNPHRLQLHDLTREDIELFARENLQSYVLYAEFESNLFNDLLHDIVDRAQGVFLWVRLAVRSLRDGITNEDPVSLLRERLQAIPSDLEEFFEQILASVDVMYRTRMANTFIATLRSEKPLNIIHYYFLEPDDATSDYELPASQWPKSEIHRRVQQTRRRLNGRFKGLLEPATTIGITSQTTVDFLHRTLRDFLVRGQMRKTLESWAAQKTHVLTSISRAMIAKSKFINEKPSCQQLKLAIELGLQASIETKTTVDYFLILDQAELEYERIGASRLGCQSLGLMIRAAVSIGHVDYVRHRLADHSTITDIGQILKHAMTCPVSPDSTFLSCLCSGFDKINKDNVPSCCFSSNPVASYIRCSPSSAVVEVLLDRGADPNTVVRETSALSVFLHRLVDSMDGKYEEDIFAIFRSFIDKRLLDVKPRADLWRRLLLRFGNQTARASRNTLRYFQALFKAGLDPNTSIGLATTMTTMLLRTFTEISPQEQETVHGNRLELLREFLRHGADINQVYEDRWGDGWLNSVRKELRAFPGRSFTSSRVAELEIFLQHGLEPNASLPNWHDAATVWSHLLDAINYNLRTYPSDEQHQRTHSRTIILCLGYGADPRAEELQDFLKWQKGSDCRLPRSDVVEMLRILEKELIHTESQAHVRAPHQNHSSQAGSMSNNRRNDRAARGMQTSQDTHKRRTMSSTDPRHYRQIKKSRCG